MARALALALLALHVSLASTALAQATEGDTAQASDAAEGFVPEEQSPTAEAARFFQEGIADFEAHRYRDAIRAFEQAAARVPSADLWYNIARAHEELSEYRPAIDHFRRYLRDRVDPPDQARVEARIARLGELAEQERRDALDEPSTGRLRLSANVVGAEAFLGGRSIGTTPMEDPLAVDPGRHELEVRHAGYLPFRAELSVEAGLTTGVFADLRPETHYRAVRGRRIWTWVLGGLGVAAGATSAGLGIYAATLHDPAAPQSTDARSWSRGSDVALGVAAALLVTATALYFVEGRAIDTVRYTEVDRDVADEINEESSEGLSDTRDDPSGDAASPVAAPEAEPVGVEATGQ